MEPAGERDHRRTPRCRPRHFHRVFRGFCPGGEQQGLGRPGKWGERVQFFRERDIAFIGADLECGVGKAFQLRLHRGHDLGVAVPGIEYGNATGEIDEAAPFHVPQFGIFGTIGEHRGGRCHAARHGLITAGKKGRVIGHGGTLRA